jgi:hypothetical protein
MKTLLLATVAAVSLAASASAQTMDGTPAPVERYAYECVVDKVTPPDHDNDPGYKVNIMLDMTHIDQVWHTRKSGKTADRAAQYAATSMAKRKGEDWKTSPLIWFGKSKKNPHLSMLGTIGTNIGNYGKDNLVYIEELFRDNEKKPIVTISTVCHQIKV